MKTKPPKMRAVIIRGISLVGLAILIAWEVWKAGDMLTSLKGLSYRACFLTRYLSLDKQTMYQVIGRFVFNFRRCFLYI